jgi:methyl-accepting chemotaxis protein
MWGELEPTASGIFLAGDSLAGFGQLKDKWGLVETTLAKLEQGYATKDNKVITAVLEDEWPLLVKGVVKPLQTLIPLAQKRSQETYEAAVGNSQRMLYGGIAGAGLCLVVLVVTALLTMRSILVPLHEVNRSLQSIADGDLSSTLPASRSDELGSMVESLQGMQNALYKLVRQVRDSARSIELASTEVASGNADLSNRTEQAASSLQVTASSTVELTGTVSQSADSARQANQLASSAADVAARGGAVVAEVITTMDGITASSRKIADIISVIDGIAFQTNILALNAAVEAARAGEQGRGFAVVASEVRSLAGRSAEAAKEIKTLINASVEQVEQGTALVDQAGSTMTEVVSSIKRVTDLMGEISAASNEQAAGVSQVGEAVTQMDQVTQQNAALVEEMAAAASSLKSQAEDLVQVVAVFNLGGNSAQHSMAPRPATVRVPASNTKTYKSPERRALAAPTKAAAPAKAGDDDWETF